MDSGDLDGMEDSRIWLQPHHNTYQFPLLPLVAMEFCLAFL